MLHLHKFDACSNYYVTKLTFIRNSLQNQIDQIFTFIRFLKIKMYKNINN